MTKDSLSFPTLHPAHQHSLHETIHCIAPSFLPLMLQYTFTVSLWVSFFALLSHHTAGEWIYYLILSTCCRLTPITMEDGRQTAVDTAILQSAKPALQRSDPSWTAFIRGLAICKDIDWWACNLESLLQRSDPRWTGFQDACGLPLYTCT